jgi:hypothetical protein
MKSPMLTTDATGARRSDMRCLILLPLAGAAFLPGCIQVRAPEKPIEINLNVNVRQEVLVRLQRDAEEIIENNPELFPQ